MCTDAPASQPGWRDLVCQAVWSKIRVNPNVMMAKTCSPSVRPSGATGTSHPPVAAVMAEGVCGGSAPRMAAAHRAATARRRTWMIMMKSLFTNGRRAARGVSSREAMR